MSDQCENGNIYDDVIDVINVGNAPMFICQ